jgi:hypothetical protein
MCSSRRPIVDLVIRRYKRRGDDPCMREASPARGMRKQVPIDGPMEHGLKGRRGQRLMALPAARGERPDPELLEWRYDRFRAAAS